jgi:hypothetical protein
MEFTKRFMSIILWVLVPYHKEMWTFQESILWLRHHDKNKAEV